VTGWREGSESEPYPQTLGPVFHALPPLMQHLHRPGSRSVWRGRAEVARGKGILVPLAAALFRFPKAGLGQPVEVTFTTDEKGRETWTRRFGTRQMRSTQETGTGRDEALIVERFGPFRFGLALKWDRTRLHLVPRRWGIGPLPLPRWLMPHGPAWEEASDGRFRFHVQIILPLIGPVAGYEGWLEPATAAPGQAPPGRPSSFDFVFSSARSDEVDDERFQERRALDPSRGLTAPRRSGRPGRRRLPVTSLRWSPSGARSVRPHHWPTRAARR